MELILTQLLGGASGLLAYVVIFAVLVACGLGVPLPEDLSLLLGGYLVHSGAASLVAMMAVGFGGILVGDSLIYLAGRRFGSKVGNGRAAGLIARIVTPEKRAKVEALFARHGEKIVMISRFLPGVRAVTYFTAGSARMPFAKFLLWDGLAALASAPVFVYLGYAFGGSLERVTAAVKDVQMTVLIAGAVALVATIAFRQLRRRRAAAATLSARTVSAPLLAETSIPVLHIPAPRPRVALPRMSAASLNAWPSTMAQSEARAGE